MGRNQAISYSYHTNPEDYIIISVNDYDYKPANFDRQNNKIKAVLKLYFNDIEFQTERGIMMSEQDAERIRMFVDTWKDKVSNIVVHCFAGISRSAGVACAVSKYLNGSDYDIWNSGKYYPNSHCYKLTCKAFGFDVTDEYIKKLREINEKAFDESKMLR
jgi:hypothetical protein